MTSMSRSSVAGLRLLASIVCFSACSSHSNDTPVDDAEVQAFSSDASRPNTLTTCATDLSSCLDAKPSSATACLSEAQQCGLFSISGAVSLTGAQLACAEKLTGCTLANPAGYALCLTDAESCGLIPKGTVALAADGGVTIGAGVALLDAGIALPAFPVWDGSVPPLPAIMISDAGVVTIPGLVVVDGGVGVAVGPVLDCANELFACLSRDPSKSAECALAAEKCLTAVKP